MLSWIIVLEDISNVYLRDIYVQIRSSHTSAFRLPSTESGVPVRTEGVPPRPGAAPSLVTSL